MVELIHLHEIFPILEEKPYKKEDLEEFLMKKYGSDVRFKNCQDIEFNFEEVLDFMVSKGKIKINNNLISLNKGCECKH